MTYQTTSFKEEIIKTLIKILLGLGVLLFISSIYLIWIDAGIISISVGGFGLFLIGLTLFKLAKK